MKIQFLGAAQEVTGSKHLITLKSGKQILLDCGMFQGRGKESAIRNRHLGFNPMEVTYLFLSHAHIDHSGLIPLMVKQGFKGKIICTPATYDLCRIMLADSAHIQQSDAEYINRKREAEGKDLIKPLYNMDDVNRCWDLFQIIDYKKQTQIDEEVEVLFTDAGHILGSAVVNLTLFENHKPHRLTFSGDIGRYINKILKTPQAFPQADTIICESTYGDRLHESVKDAKENLKVIVEETCYEKRGKLIIPAFSIGKTQELIFMLNKLGINKGPNKIKVFVDSPLAISATEIMKDHIECFGPATIKFMQKGADPFGFDQLYYVREAEYSKLINEIDEPCIIISASGMADAGRIKHHLANGITDEKNTVLIIGYSEPSSLSGRLQRGAEEVRIFGQHYPVKAKVSSIDFFSAHADYNEILRFLSCQDPTEVSQIFLVHGDIESQTHLKQMLDQKYNKVDIAEPKEDYFI
ncbi:MAG: MBL fold metallo-hydrolase [Flavobacteriales bacterium]|nr:MBL fold metallo-hydrolase [Flavobacteriales bacterium]